MSYECMIFERGTYANANMAWHKRLRLMTKGAVWVTHCTRHDISFKISYFQPVEFRVEWH